MDRNQIDKFESASFVTNNWLSLTKGESPGKIVHKAKNILVGSRLAQCAAGKTQTLERATTPVARQIRVDGNILRYRSDQVNGLLDHRDSSPRFHSR